MFTVIVLLPALIIIALFPSLYLESVVDVEAVVAVSPEKITGCSQQDVELKVTKVREGGERGRQGERVT